MPKLKTNSSCKKRFRLTSSGKVAYKATGKSHNMRNKSGSQIRDKRKKSFLESFDVKRILKNFMPNSK